MAPSRNPAGDKARLRPDAMELIDLDGVNLAASRNVADASLRVPGAREVAEREKDRLRRQRGARSPPP